MMATVDIKGIYIYSHMYCESTVWTIKMVSSKSVEYDKAITH